jgi:predicted enzyme related to lactoylglutathione lyase
MSHTVLLYVTDVAASAAYYAAVLDDQPLEQSPGFAMFSLAPRFGLGLWRKDVIVPAATAPAGATELGIRVDTPADVDTTYAAWRERGATIALEPTDLEFGRSFVAVDPDGHRLRVYTLNDAA